MGEVKKYPLVSVISVNYNQAQITIETIESLKKASYPNLEIIIVDNASTENPDCIKQQFEDIKFIKSSKNLGFAGGNNLGIREANGEYLLFLNSDTEVDPDFLQPLVELLQSNPEIGMVSPKLVYFFSENKSLIQYAGANKMNYLTGRNSSIGFKAQNDGTYDDVRETHFPHGAAMLLPAKVVKKVGLMPDIYFLYYEELDWAEMVKRNGFKIYYHGGSTVYHKESMSVGKDNPLKVFYMNRNRIVYIRRNAGFFTFLVNFIFYSFVSVPVNTLKFFMKRNLVFVGRLFKAYCWNLTHFNVKTNPFLSDNNEIVYSKI